MSVPFLKKDAMTIRTEMKAVINAMGLGAMYEAGKAKAIMDGVSDKLASLYETTYEGMLNVNVSTAQEVWLDIIANSVAVVRFLAEPDESLRARIIMNMALQRMCNEDAILMRLKLHPRVKDVTFIDFVYGAGSYAAFIDPIDGTEADSGLLQELQALAKNTSAKGAKMIVTTAVKRRVRIVASVRGSAVQAVDVASAISQYINARGLGKGLYIDEIRAQAVNVGANHIDFHEIYVDDQRILPRDFPVAWDERLVVDSSVATPIAIAA